MSILKIDDQNEIYYEFTEPKGNGHTFVFVNALTGSTAAWNGIIGDKITEEGMVFLPIILEDRITVNLVTNLI